MYRNFISRYFCRLGKTLNEVLICSPQKYSSQTYTTQASHTSGGHEQNSDYFLSKALHDINLETVFQDENIVAINKPQGVSVNGSVYGKSIVDMLPLLANKYGCKDGDLEVGIGVKSFYSGLIVLSKSKKVKEALQKSTRRDAATRNPYLSYLAITNGVPECDNRTKHLQYLERVYLHNTQMSTVIEKCQNKRKANTACSVNYVVDPLVVNTETGAALVKVLIDKDKWDAVPCMLSHHLSPILGDEIYSRRVSSLIGTRMAVPPHSAPPGPQSLPEEIKIQIKDQELLDGGNRRLMLHRYQMHLTQVPNKHAKPLTLTAKPPLLFIETLKHLGLYKEDLFDTQIGPF